MARKYVTFGFGVLFFTLGISLIVFQETLLSLILEFILNLTSNSHIFHLWQRLPVEVPTTFMFFNWTNNEDFLNKSIKPKLQEIGPYRFLQNLERIDTVWNDNHTITFRQIRTFHYDHEFPNNGNLSDTFTSFHYISMCFGHIIRYWSDLYKDILSEFLSLIDPYPYFNTTVGAETINGNDNYIIELGNYFTFMKPEIPRFDRFGWLKMRNGDPNFDGVFNMGNGENRQFDVLNWNYHSSTPYFDKSCAKIRGSMGDLHSDTLNKQFIYVFISDMCRYIRMYFEKEVFVDGILGYKYSISKLTLDNGTKEPENKCFCNGDCIPSGLFNLSSCRYGANAFVSLPHLYNADEIYVSAFEGLNPEKEKHEAYIVVEPNTMILIDFKLRIQANSYVHPVEGISNFNDFPKLYFPLFWMEQKSEIPNEIKKYLKMYLKVPYVLIGMEALLIIVGLVLASYVILYQLYNTKYSDISKIGINVAAEKVPLNKSV